jgi:drug/metabolite transporter superfamily protein YnfA
MIYTMASVIAYFGFDKVLYLLSFTNYGVTYLNWSKYNTTFERSSILFMFVRIIMLLGCLAFYKDLRAKDSSINVLYNMAIVCTITQLLTVRLYLFGRITTYFYVTYIFLIPEIMGLIKERYSKNKRIVLYGIIIIALLLYHFVYYYSSSGAVGSGYEVYKSVFF